MRTWIGIAIVTAALLFVGAAAASSVNAAPAAVTAEQMTHRSASPDVSARRQYWHRDCIGERHADRGDHRYYYGRPILYAPPYAFVPFVTYGWLP